MSLYDFALGDGRQRQRGALLLGVLEFPSVARFRDAWVETSDDGPVIVIYTRQGGPNRTEKYCADSNRVLAAHPLYLRDRDDTFDHTYCTFYFRGPDEVRAELTELAVAPVDTDARWQEAIRKIHAGEISPAQLAAADQFFAGITDPSPSKVRIIRI